MHLICQPSNKNKKGNQRREVRPQFFINPLNLMLLFSTLQKHAQKLQTDFIPCDKGTKDVKRECRRPAPMRMLLATCRPHAMLFCLPLSSSKPRQYIS